MPELPEVETTRRQLEPALVGRTFTSVEVSHARTARNNASKGEVVARLNGRRIQSVGRHGKYLVLDLNDGYKMVAHLGMSGRFVLSGPEDELQAHTHFVANLDDGTQLRFIDPRTFGFIGAYDEDELESTGLGRLGPDAWFNPPDTAGLLSSLQGRTAPVKALLLDQGPIAGLGNIYADEALYVARIHPLTPGGRLDEDSVNRLLSAVREVLTSALESGGTTLGDSAYLLPDGRAGENMPSLNVYGRHGEPCRRCGTSIERIVVRARSTHFCPECQGE